MERDRVVRIQDHDIMEFPISKAKRSFLFFGLLGTILCAVFVVLRYAHNSEDVSGSPYANIHTLREGGSREKQKSQPTRSLKINTSKDHDLGTEEQRRQLLYKRAKGLHPSEAKAFLLEIKSSVNSAMRRKELGKDVMVDLVKRGYAQEAWALVDPTHGMIRDAQIQGFFAGLPSAADRMRYLANIEDEVDRKNALEGMLKTIEPKDLKELSKYNTVWSNDEKTRIAIQLGLAFDVPEGLRDDQPTNNEVRDAIESMVDLYKEKNIGPDQISTILRYNNFLSPDETIEILDRLSSYNNGTLVKSYETAVSDMFSRDSVKALDVTLNRKTIPSLTGAVLSAYMKHDSIAAIQWFESHESQMSSDQYDSGVNLLVNEAIKSDELQAAEEWILKINSNQLKRQAEAKLKSKRDKIQTVK